MTTASGASQEKDSSKLPSSCPYLGMQSDPQTHVGVPDTRNYCNFVEHPKSVKLSHQEKYCLRSAYLGCEVYIRSGELPLPADIFETDGNGRQAKTSPLIVGAWARKKGKQSTVAEVTQEIETTQAVERTSLPENDIEIEDTAWPEVVGQPRWRGGLFITLAILLLVIIVVGWNAYSRFQTSRNESAQVAQSGFIDGLATAVQGVGIVANDWGTAIVQMENPTWTPAAILMTATTTTSTPTPILTTPTPTGPPPVCQDIPSIAFQVISGPDFDPRVGVILPIYRAPALGKAVWNLKNTGSCSWTQILLWSSRDNKIITPVIKRGDQIINPGELQGNPIAAPGEEIEVVLEFPVLIYRNLSVADEWTLVVNGISLSEQPKFKIDARNWIIILQPTETSSRPTRVKGGEPEATVETPPTRP